MIDGVRALIDAEKALAKQVAAPLAANDDTNPDIVCSSTSINYAVPTITPKI